MTPKEWNELLNGDASSAQIKNATALHGRLYLVTLGVEQTISTEKFVEALYPRAEAEKTLKGDTARKKLYGIITKLAHHGLEDCCIKGEVTGQYMGRPKRPWIWFCPAERETCCMCGQVLPKDS